jgi:hypothetical protein
VPSSPGQTTRPVDEQPPRADVEETNPPMHACADRSTGPVPHASCPPFQPTAHEALSPQGNPIPFPSASPHPYPHSRCSGHANPAGARDDERERALRP